MATIKITKRTVDHLGTSSKKSIIWDSAIVGFGLRCRANGRKYFVVKYRFESRQRWFTIGQYGSPWTVDQARNEAKKLLGEIASGKDPSTTRDLNKNANTISELCDIYIDNYARLHKKPRSCQSDEGNIRNHIKPLIGRLKVNSVTRQDIETFKRNVADGKTAVNRKLKPRVRLRVKGGPGAANRCLALLSKMFNLAEEWGLRDEQTNPVRRIKKFRERKIERYLSDEEMAQLGCTLANATNQGLADQASIDAIRLLIFTGCRLSEILSLKWDYIDYQREFLQLPDSKTGAKVVYLPTPAIEVLNGIPRLNDNPYVFAGNGASGHIINLRKPWHRIRAKAKLDDVRLHDLRHSFASVAAGEGMSLHIIGRLLGHTQAATTARYAHLAANPMKAAAKQIGERISSLLGPIEFSR